MSMCPPPLPWQFTCCGANNYTDWATIERFKVNDTVPRSCCRINTTTCNIHPSAATIYEKVSPPLPPACPPPLPPPSPGGPAAP